MSTIHRCAASAVVAAGMALAQFAPPAPPPPPAVLAMIPEPPEPQAPPAPPAPPAHPAGVTGSFLGVHVSEVDSDRARELNLKEERGVEVTGVEEGSPAEKAGVRKGDVVLEYNGQRVEGTQQFIRVVRETPPGRQVKLGIHRGGSPMTIAATIGTRKGGAVVTRTGNWLDIPRFNVWVPDVPRPAMSWGNAMLGVEAEGVEGQLADFFGVKHGALVRSVAKGSPAEKAGMKAGDVVTKVDLSQVASARDLFNQIRSSRSRKSFPITVVREKRETTVQVTLDEEAGRTAPRPARGVVRREQRF